MGGEGNPKWPPTRSGLKKLENMISFFQLSIIIFDILKVKLIFLGNLKKKKKMTTTVKNVFFPDNAYYVMY